VAPGDFFAKSGKYDESMKNWVIEYELIDKKVNPRLPIQRTASFPSLKWNRKALERHVEVFGVSRTVPATERKDLVKAIGNNKDRHVIFEQIGEDLDFTSEITVANAFLAIWAQERPDEAKGIVDKFSLHVPLRS
jgi:hypothetical protein